MCITALVAGGVASSAIGARSASKAADAQTQAANRQIDLSERIYDETTERFQPYYDAGTNALAGIMFELGMGEAPEGYSGFTATPGYDFRLNQGMDALEGSAAARGGLLTGNTLEGIQAYGQDMASREYGNYFNRLAGVMSGGQAAAAGQANAGANYQAGASNALTSIGNAQAAGYIGQANALTGGINNALGAYQYQNFLNTPFMQGQAGG